MLNVEGQANLHDVSANHINLAGTITGHNANLNDVTLTGTITGHNANLNDVTLSGTITGHNANLNDVTLSGTLDVTGNTTMSGTLTVKASATTTATSRVPVFTADPASTAQTLVTRSTADFRGDIGALSVVNLGITNGTTTGPIITNTGGDSATIPAANGTSASGIVTTTTQTFAGTKTFSSTITGSITGNAGTVTNGVYTTGDQSIAGNKTFSSTITGSITGNADTVTNGVYTTGDQSIAGNKTFSSTITGSITGNAGSVTNGVYTTGDQSIAGNKTFSSTITGSITGNAGTVTNGVYTTGNQSIAGNKTFTGNTTLSGTLGVTGTTTITTLSNSKITSTDRIIINNAVPTLYLKDTNHRSGMIHMNDDKMYFLSGGTNTETWSQINGQWPLYLQTNTNEAVFGGVVNARDIYRLYITDDNGATNIPWEIKNHADGNLGFYQGCCPLQLKGFIEDDGGVRNNRMNFTGQHRTFIKNIPYTSISGEYVGLIVCANQNTNISMSGSIKKGNQAITQNETLPYCSLSYKNYDKSCFGVISEAEDPNERVDKYGAFCTPFEKEQGDTRIYINSVGEGGIWVTNKNGPLESGDYITTCDLPGYGMKQDSEFLANYTVAKITMNCDFNPVYQPVPAILKDTSGENILDEYGQIQWTDLVETQWFETSGNVVYEYEYNIRYLDASGQIIDKDMSGGFIGAYVGCTYHCG